MTIDLWIAFVLAASVIIAIPGPINFMVMAVGLRSGIRPTFATIVGVIPGIIVSMTLSFIGLGAILAASAELFMLVKWAGALYLIYLGIMQWRLDPHPEYMEGAIADPQRLDVMTQAFTAALLNPKAIIFFATFMPQFISSSAPVLPQMLILGATFIVIGFPIHFAYAVMAGGFRETIRNVRVLRTLNRLGGSILIGAGVMTASLKRT
ncbi:MAG: LysE family translocator [Elainellaceae cyanobacterium]